MRTLLALIISALCCTLLLVSCAPKQPDMATLRKTMDEFNAASKDAMLNGNMDKVMSYYEDNAMELAPNAAMVKGKEGIRAFMNQMMSSGMKISTVEFGTVELDASGKVAYEIGTYDMSMTVPQMGEMKDKGKYMSIWRQQADGSWKVHAETWNTDMPMPSMDQMTKKDDMKKEMKK